MAEKWQYRETYRGVRSVPAETVGTALEDLRATGDLAPSRYVEVAKPKDSPLHPTLTWDDKKAANEFRLIEARTIIRGVIRVEVVTETDTRAGEPRVIGGYVHVPSEDRRGEGKYQPVELVIENVDEYGRALDEARKDLESAERRLHELRRLSEGRNDGAEALAIAIQGIGAVREALQLLKVAA